MVPYHKHLQPYLAEAVPHLSVLGFFIAIGFATGLFQAITPADSTLSKESWSVPQISRPETVSLVDEDITDRFWADDTQAPKKKGKPADTKKPTIDPWNFVGTVEQGGIIVAVIDIKGKGIRRLRDGELLPDGSSIVQISEGMLSFEREGLPGILHLFAEKKPNDLSK